MITVYQRLILWLQAVTDVTVIVRNPSAPEPAAPFVSLKVTNNGDLANHRYVIDVDGIQRVTRFQDLTVSIQIQGRPTEQVEAEEIAQKIMDALTFPDQMLDHFNRTLAYTSIRLAPNTIDQLTGVEWSNRVVMDVGFSATRDIEHDVGVIETVELDGTIGSVEIKREVTI